MKSSDIGPEFSYTITSHSLVQELDYQTASPIETSDSGERVPVSAFAHASTMQALARYLVDVKGESFAAASRILGRSPKSIWTSYHQTAALPPLDGDLSVPLRIFAGILPPLEALVLELKKQGLRNVEIAALLQLDPRTTWTAAKRGEARR